MFKKLFCLLPLVQLALLTIVAQAQDGNFYARPGVTPAEIIRARGFKAEEHFITTEDGYILKITRGVHPRFNGGNGGLPNRAPILFVHGILEDPVVFLINSFYVRPKDLSSYNLSANAEGLVYEPSARVLPFFAMNCGHEVWFLSRRGAPGSQRKVGNPNGIDPNGAQRTNSSTNPFGLPSTTNQFSNFSNSDLERFSFQTFTTAPAAFADYGQLPEKVRFSFDADFWKFSFDEQARYDFNQSIDYVLVKTKRTKLAVVAHSAGGAIALMSLSLYPELANKISKLVLWSHGFSLGKLDLFNTIVATKPFFETYVGSVPPAFSTTQIQAGLGLFCATALTQRTLCESAADLFLGPSAGMEPIYPEFINSLLYPTGSREFAQNLQCVQFGGVMHMYDYGPAGNLEKYGQLIPPSYDPSQIKLPNISFYVGATDFLVSPTDVAFVLPFLTVPYEFHLIETAFNHQGYFYHDENARLVIIPTMIDIQRADSQQ